MRTAIRLLAGAVVLLLVVSFLAFKEQDAPITVTCGTVSGGDQMTGAGITAARTVGGIVHQLAEGPLPDADEVKRTFVGMWRDVAWYWVKAYLGAARGTRIDPQVLRKEAAAKRAAAAADQGCTPCPTATPDPGSGADPLDSLTAAVSGSMWSAGQRRIAATAVAVGKSMRIPVRGWIVAVAAGMQESGLRNLTYGDRDSVGVLQQRQGWGSTAERMNVARAFGRFYQHLLTVPRWRSMSVTAAAQAVQVSAHPNAYAKWEDDARQLVAQLGDVPAGETQPADPEPQCVDPNSSSAASTVMANVNGYRKVTDPTSGIEWNIPIPAGPRGVAINFALDQVQDGDWYQWGGHGPDVWDCSGLVAAAWGKAGVRLTPQTESMRAQIPLVDTPAAGDLLYKPGHVQMYLGQIGGQTLIVEAPRTGSRMRIRPQWMTPTAILDPTLIGRRS